MGVSLVFPGWRLVAEALTLSQKTKFRLFQTAEFADDILKLMKMAEKFSYRIENSGKRRYCSLLAISPFPAVFSKGLLYQGLVLEELYN